MITRIDGAPGPPALAERGVAVPEELVAGLLLAGLLLAGRRGSGRPRMLGV